MWRWEKQVYHHLHPVPLPTGEEIVPPTIAKRRVTLSRKAARLARVVLAFRKPKDHLPSTMRAMARTQAEVVERRLSCVGCADEDLNLLGRWRIMKPSRNYT